jgi:threonine dehydrogenase-like Zn-dependent dehydrogenase
VRALTVEPGISRSVRLEQVSEPEPDQGDILAATLAVGVCGTDHEIIEGHYGTAPPGQRRLILGHESLGKVLEAPVNSGLRAGDLVVGIVRHPDPVPCANCAIGEWDMCRNGLYTERGIKQAHGYCAELFRTPAAFAVRVDSSLGVCGVLLEPASVVAKAWEHVEAIGRRARWEPRRALVTGAGPVGLLAALFAAQRGLEVHVLDRSREGPKPKLVRSLGAAYHTGPLTDLGFQPDVVIECTGAPQIVLDAVSSTSPGGIVCLAGISSGQHRLSVDVSLLNRQMVLENDVVVGSVNANRRHYESAARALAAAERPWLEALITAKVPLTHWEEAYRRTPDGIKSVLCFSP